METMRWIIAIAGPVIAVAVSFLMALTGEPQAVWLWRDVFGVL